GPKDRRRPRSRLRKRRSPPRKKAERNGESPRSQEHQCRVRQRAWRGQPVPRRCRGEEDLSRASRQSVCGRSSLTCQPFVEPPRLPASVFVVIHIPEKNSTLEQVLGRCGQARVAKAMDGHRVERGRVYVAPGGSHLVLNDGQMQLNKGPRENRHRPSVDTLFR